MYDNVIKLISETITIDSYGDRVIEETENVVFAELKSISMSEFYQSQAVGLKPEIKFVLPDVLEYNGQKRLKYTPYQGTEEIYTVLRTFQNGNLLELVCKKGIE